jgi:co-chaperonin GroES (HSP10)
MKKTTIPEATTLFVTPRHDRVLVTRDEPASGEQAISDGGIYIPEGAVEQPQTGVVEAVGPKVEGLAVGDRVLFGKFAQELKLNGKTRVYLLRDEEIIATLREEFTKTPLTLVKGKGK